MKLLRNTAMDTVSQKIFPTDGLVERPALEKRTAGRSLCLVFVGFVLAASGVGVVTFFQSRYETIEHVTACEKPAASKDCQETTQYPMTFDAEVNPFYPVRVTIRQHFTADELANRIGGMYCGIAIYEPSLIWRNWMGQPTGMKLDTLCAHPDHLTAAVVIPPSRMAGDIGAFMVQAENEARLNTTVAQGRFAFGEVTLGRSGSAISTDRNMSLTFWVQFPGNIWVGLNYGAEPDCGTVDWKVMDIIIHHQNKTQSRCGVHRGDQKCLNPSNTYQLLKQAKIEEAMKIVDYLTFSAPAIKMEIPYQDEFFLQHLRKEFCSGYTLLSELQKYETYWVGATSYVLSTTGGRMRNATQVASDLAKKLLKPCPFKWICKVPSDYPNPFVWFSVAYPLLMIVLRLLLGQLPSIYGFFGEKDLVLASSDLKSTEAWGEPHEKDRACDAQLRQGASID